MRVRLHQVAILEDPGLTLLAIGHEVLRRAVRRTAALPLHRGREVGAPAAEETGVRDRGGDGVRIARVEGAREGAVAPRVERVVERARTDRAPPLGEAAVLTAQRRMRRVR